MYEYHDDPIMAEVRARKAHVLEMYGGIEGLHKHMDEDRPRLEREGWKFVSPEKLAAMQRRPIRHDAAWLAEEQRYLEWAKRQ
jgi:hypothetical protein